MGGAEFGSPTEDKIDQWLALVSTDPSSASTCKLIITSRELGNRASLDRGAYAVNAHSRG